MTEQYYNVSIKVTAVHGTCRAGHKVGDEWIVREKDYKTPGGICLAAFHELYNITHMMMYGGSAYFQSAPDYCGPTSSCPDPDHPVFFETRRIPADNSQA